MVGRLTTLPPTLANQSLTRVSNQKEKTMTTINFGTSVTLSQAAKIYR